MPSRLSRAGALPRPAAAHAALRHRAPAAACAQAAAAGAGSRARAPGALRPAQMPPLRHSRLQEQARCALNSLHTLQQLDLAHTEHYGQEH